MYKVGKILFVFFIVTLLSGMLIDKPIRATDGLSSPTSKIVFSSNNPGGGLTGYDL